MIRVVVEVPATAGLGTALNREIRTERDAVWWVRDRLVTASYPSMGRRVKAYARVRTAERLKTVGEDDTATRLRRLRDELSDIIKEHE